VVARGTNSLLFNSAEAATGCLQLWLTTVAGPFQSFSCEKRLIFRPKIDFSWNNFQIRVAPDLFCSLVGIHKSPICHCKLSMNHLFSESANIWTVSLWRNHRKSTLSTVNLHSILNLQILLRLYDSFPWKCYTPEIHQIQKLKFSSTNTNCLAASFVYPFIQPCAIRVGSLVLRILVSPSFPYFFHFFSKSDVSSIWNSPIWNSSSTSHFGRHLISDSITVWDDISHTLCVDVWSEIGRLVETSDLGKTG